MSNKPPHNRYQSASSAYGKAGQVYSEQNPRIAEGQALMKAANELSTVMDQWLESNQTPANLDDALVRNRKLWTIFMTETEREDSPLPDQLKANIRNLSLFIFQQTIGITATPEPQKLKVLISINRNIAAGLLHNPNDAPEEGRSPHTELGFFNI
jgi:flagellar biosynthesis activator protein FlaF